jgi:hypothetical protein
MENAQFSFSVWAEIVRDLVVGLYLIPDRQMINDKMTFRKLLCRCCLKMRLDL